MYASSEGSGESAQTPAPLLLCAYFVEICTKIALFAHLTHLCLEEFPHLYQLEQSISVLRVVGWYFFHFIQILIEHSASKQWRH